MTDDMMKVRVQITLDYLIPANLDERRALYGTTDPAECLRIDLENDPAAFFLESDTDIDYASVVVVTS